MKLPLYQVDAFANRPFAGNPAAVCPLAEWLPDSVLQSIAAENNLAETAYFVPDGEDYKLRWFTPAVEVDLCGHATLASAYVIMNELRPDLRTVRFHSRSGPLIVTRESDRYALDFPARPPKHCEAPAGLLAALGGEAELVLAARDHFVVYGTEEEVLALKPDMLALSKVECFAVIVTAPGRDVDFVSRFFAPAQGIPEDPVTGSAHCTLIPYWADRLGEGRMRARQVSARGGELWCEMRKDRVKIAGKAVPFLKGEIEIPASFAAGSH